ncbi:MAG: hypothetical protein EP332_14300 [Bacteroidetes bacterium]|nr:MAG: hypothetical protein EP332_14300 [Bacteroidota bacterium]
MLTIQPENSTLYTFLTCSESAECYVCVMSEVQSYSQRIEACQLRQQKLKRELLSLALLRAFVFVLTGLAAYLLYPATWMAIPIFVFLIGFLLLMREQSKKRARLNLEIALGEILEREAGTRQEFTELSELDEIDTGLGRDLDLFGAKGLFAKMHRSYAHGAAVRLAKRMVSLEIEAKLIREQQQDAVSLQEKADALFYFLAHSRQADFTQSKADKLIEWSKEVTKDVYLIQLIIFPSLMLMSVVAWMLFGLDDYFMTLFFFLNLGLVMRRNKEIKALHESLDKVHPALAQLAHQLEHWHTSVELRAELNEATKALNQLAKIMARLDSRLNPFGMILFNGLLQYDLQTLRSLHQWKQHYAQALPGWLSELYELEIRSSRSLYVMREGGVFPELLESDFHLEFDQLRHPLMAKDKAVPNSWSSLKKGEINILTGSNMSGKSTFLRSMGTSLVLAQNAYPVPAKSFKLSPVHLISSIRVSDSLEEDASYFYAELRRMKEIIETAKTESRIFFLLDEILRGTNSKDKQAGSRGVLLKLLEQHANGILATHDLSLTEMEQEFPGQIRNYAFESQEKDGELYFDYTLHAGVCQNLNAVFLMRKMGIMG